MPALEMAQAIKTKKLSPVEVINAVLNRIERLNLKINAYCTVLDEYAREKARESEVKLMNGDKLVGVISSSDIVKASPTQLGILDELLRVS